MELAMRAATTRRVFGLSTFVGCCVLALPVAMAQKASDSQPRLADGHPDFSGTWDNGSGIDFVQPRKDGKSVCVFGCPGAPPPPDGAGAPSPPKGPQYKPEFAARVADLNKRQVSEDPVLRCKAPGVPRIGPPDKIVQRPGEAVFLYDDVSGGFFRIVPTDGRAHRKDVEPSFLGESVGHWEGDTLEWAATVYDAKVLTGPWEVVPRTARLTDVDLVEAAPCVDQDIDHIVDGSHHPNPR